MIVLIILGATVALFGGLVLVKFPDRPGGRIALGGLEVSSVGAGLPLIALGVVVTILGARHSGTGSASTPTAIGPTSPSPNSSDAGCFARYFQDMLAKRIRTIEYGALDQPIVRPGEPQEELLGLEFTNLGKPVGAMTVRFVAASRIFRIVSVVNDQCGSIDTFEDTTNQDAPAGVLENHDILQVVWGGKRYEVRLGANSDITVRFVGGAST